jgi:hypothetical protein
MRKKNFTRQVGLILSEESYNRILEETNRKEVTVSAWVRQAIEMRLKSDARIILKNPLFNEKRSRE